MTKRWIVSFVLLAIGLVPCAARAEAPRPVAGIVPLTIEDVAEAEGPNLRIDDYELDLVGKRVRFVAEVDDVGTTSAGEHYVALEGDGERVVLALPGPLEDAHRLDDEDEWSVIARYHRPVTLADGRRAIFVGPDVLVKTPGPPGAFRPEDVVLTVAGEEFFQEPTSEPWESEKPLHRITITDEGRNPEDFLLPDATGFAAVRKKGKQLYDYQQVTRAKDGRKRAQRCVYELAMGRLRNTQFGEVELDAKGERTRQRWVDFGSDKFRDTWSAARKSFPPNTYQAACLSIGMTGYPVESRVVRFYVWGERGMPVPVYAYIDGEETLNTRGRDEKAYRIKIGLDVRRAATEVDVPEPFKKEAEAAVETWHAGDSTYWIAAEEPHDVLRFEGPLGPPGSPIARVDRIG